MYSIRLSGTRASDDDAESGRVAAALRAYNEYVESLDLSNAGDLLLYFGYDFFHDGDIRSLALANQGQDLHLDLTAWIETTDDDAGLPDEVNFQARFIDVVWFEVCRESGHESGISEFLYSEIDGMTARIAEASETNGSTFHSLLIECDEGWISLVFRTVSVVPDDAVLWARVLRSPHAVMPLYGVSAAS